MRSGTRALLQLASPLLRLQSVDLYQKLHLFTLRYLFCFGVEINKAGMFEIKLNQGQVPAWVEQRSHIKLVLENEPNLGLEDRTVKALRFEDLDMIVAACDDYIRAFANPCYE
ncbi:hypothetical protein BDV97DRAFT_361717 [Delphinella strobiligena]|nr:hypothetical protein BDV97DRAFT_361717 [Delphinella strobiligena]